MTGLRVDALAVIEELLGLPRFEACTRKRVNGKFPPGPCPKGLLQRKLKKIAKRRAQARGPVKAYTGPELKIPDQAAWDKALQDAVLADYSGDGRAEMPDREAAGGRVSDFRAGLNPAQQRRFDQERRIGERQEQWRRQSGDSAQQAQQKMTAALKDLWGGKKIAVRVTPDSLESILRTERFKTVHETYKSGGSNSQKNRGDLEEQLFGIDPKTSPKEERPVYGYVAVNGIRWQKLDPSLGQYGNVQVVLKDDVRKRTTASNGDSMGERGLVRPSPVDAPDHFSYSVRGQQPGNYSVDGQRLVSDSYAEAQIHGGVSISDIEEVVFAREPEERITRRLGEKGIPWRIVQD